MKVSFGAFTFDGPARELRVGDEPVHLSPKAFELLGVLLRNRPNAISKADLHSELWPDTFVSDSSLAVLVAEIRRAIGDSGRHSSFIRTVNRYGYAFVGTTSELAREKTPGDASSTYALIWNGERAKLNSGENIIGRDTTADICIDALGVSRRHALVIVTDHSVTVSDLASKNGTFVDGARVESPLELHDGAEIRLGGVSVQFRRSRSAMPTQTISNGQIQGKSS